MSSAASGERAGAGRAVGRPPVLRGRALVTGGTSGIGLAFADALAGRGCDLVLVARDGQRLERTAGELRARHGVDVETLVADLAERDQVDKVAARLTDPNSPVEILINNAGKGIRSHLATDETSEHEHAIDVMIRAVLVLGAAAAHAMAGRGHGVIVNVSSVAGLIPMGGYAAIKAWVTAYSESLSLELADAGVRVTALLPGWVRTEFHQRAGIRASSIPSAFWLDASTVVASCLADVEKGRPRSVPSARFKVLGWLAQHAPRPMVRRVTAKLVRGRR